MGGWLQFGRGEVGWGTKRGRRRRNRGRECRQSQYVPPFSDGFTDRKLPSVIPSIIPLEKNPRHHAVATFKKSFSPSAIPPVYTNGSSPSANTGGITDGIISSLKISDEKILLVILLVLSDFLVVLFRQKNKLKI
jgi:hypothetical protein